MQTIVVGNGRVRVSPKPMRADGTPSVYGFRCGYVQREEIATGAAEIYREHDCYHVRRFDYRKRDAGAPLAEWRQWDSFPLSDLSAARKRYREFVRTVRRDSK